ncbi:putative nucleotide-diphospho-sugar transferase [Iodidimonas sp. SYSU 1G8]|uniref:putative nucleotide-diphospho-sugar transferase n=1 Tax=Iodidimonas sp. SYSU 1G8 TaxID=3133967 RepID=UPI0031FE5C6D
MKIVTSVNEPYLGLLDVWRRQSSRHVPGSTTVVCMDEGAFARCALLDGVDAVRASSGPATAARHDFWLRRFDALATAHEADDLLHTDADAFWLRPVSPLLGGLPDDMIFSREYGIPRTVAAKWGFVLCCGFFLARSTPATRAFFARWRDATRRRMDDQLALNELLVEMGATWASVDVEGRQAERCVIRVGGASFSILALPHSTVSREPPYGAPDAFVAHPYFERQFFRSYVDLMDGLLDETGSVTGAGSFPIAASPEGIKPRDFATGEALRWLLERRPDNPAHWAHLGQLSLRMSRPVEAGKALDAAQSLRPHDSATLFNLGMGLAALGRHREAVGHLRGLVGRADLEFDLARKASARLARLGAWPAATELAIHAARTVSMAGGMTLAARLLRRAVARG